MAVNPYFHANYSGKAEQGLLSSLIQECIQVQGLDIVYMPRESVNFDYLFGEDSIPKYSKTYTLEAYIKESTGYVGKGQLMSKLGLDDMDDLVLQIHIKRFEDVVTRHEPDRIRPREGDIIYFPLDTYAMFEISFVDNKKPFFQLGDLYVYEVTMKQIVQGGQKINTGNEEIDNITTTLGNMVDIQLGASLTPALNYIIGEVAFQYNTDNTTYYASGEILGFADNILTLRDVAGDFIAGKNIHGDTSGAIYTFPVKDDTTFNDVANKQLVDNREVNIEGYDVIDKSETNPFADF